MKTSIGDRILARVSEKVGAAPCRRDIQVVNYSKIAEGAVRVTATYAGKEPTYEDLRNWAIVQGNSSFRVKPESIGYHDTMPYPIVSFLVVSNKQRKPLQEAIAQGYIALSENRYLDKNLGVQWGVEEVDGKSFLVRLQDDGIENYINQMTASVSVGPKTRQTSEIVLSTFALSNDKVRYIRPDNTVGFGTVVNVTPDGTRIVKDKGTGNTFERPPAAILEITEEGADTKDRKKRVMDYQSFYLGKDLSNQMKD